MTEKAIDRLLTIMERLRDPQSGCPWDIEQTPATIAPHTIEEAYEVADAIDHGDMAHLREELGDLLFQVVFYAQMGREAGHFDFDDIAREIGDKMVRRHPHVFGDVRIDTSAEQLQAWEATKEAERSAKADGTPPSALDGVALGLPALLRATKLQRRAARVGFDWTAPLPVLDKIQEEAEELRAEIDAGSGIERLEDEIGDLLFSCVNLARKLDLDPETALRRANGKFERRFRSVEARVIQGGGRVEDASLAELDALWEAVKDEDETA